MITELTFGEFLPRIRHVTCSLMLLCIFGGNVTFQLEPPESKGVVFSPFQIHGTLSSILGPQGKNPEVLYSLQTPLRVHYLSLQLSYRVDQ